jgi:hypothetical protein
MSLDDREQNFEKALAGSLRSSNAAPGNDCLDAETLAAYHDRLLDPEEMTQRKAHIASCERCQEILAQLEATDGIAVEADRDLLLDQIVLELPETEPTPAGGAEQAAVSGEPAPSAETTPPAEAPGHAASQPEPASEVILDSKLLHDPELVPAFAPAPSTDLSLAAAAAPVTVGAARITPASSHTVTFRAPREDRPKMVRFVALFGAIAAAVIFWLLYRDQSNKSFELAQSRQQSKLELPPQSPASPPSESKDAAPSSQIPEPKNATPQTQSTAAPATAQPAPSKPDSPQAGAENEAVVNALKDAKKTVDSAKALQKQSHGDAVAGFSPRQERDQSASAGALVAPRALQSTALDTNAGKLKSTIPAPNIDSAIAAANLPSGIPATPPPARTKMNPGVVTESVTVEAVSPALAQVSTSTAADASSKPANGRIAAALTPLSVPAPNGKTIWRIGQAGVIQRSSDSGTTWSIQPSGVVTDLIAGSAYSDQICWLVGRNGTILRTTNGGATWQKLTSPSNVDLLAVFSINADSATVTDAAGRAFETTTGGAHWTRTRLQP